jgi:hypothetical protein
LQIFLLKGLLLDKNTSILIVVVFCVALILFGAFLYYKVLPNWNNPWAGGSGGGSPTPTPTPYQQQPYPTYPPYPTPTPFGIAPTSLYLTVDPNPVTMGSTIYGEVTSGGRDYLITIHAKHVGEGTEQTVEGRLDEDGWFGRAQVMNIPGYWDFWATADNGVTSGKPRLTVQGAALSSSKTFFSRMIGDYSTTLKLYCHSSGTATIFINDGSTSTPIGTVHINSGGYGTGNFDLASYFSGRSLGNYEFDFVVNGIKASDYGESVWVNYNR